MQRLLNRAVWDESGVREDLRGYVVEALGAPDGVLVFDETGDIKQGSHTVGVARQYTGVTGQVENCQVSVHAGYVSSRGQALVDVELYLPKAFALDPARCAEAGVPPERAGRGGDQGRSGGGDVRPPRSSPPGCRSGTSPGTRYTAAARICEPRWSRPATATSWRSAATSA